MIIDSVMLNDELDILECRLTELQEFPDLKHMIVEAEVTHRGDNKPLWYLEYAERFSPWKDRIIHVRVKKGDIPSEDENPDPWSREHAQREFVRHGLREAHSSDWLLHGDADEIPDPQVLARIMEGKPTMPCALQMRLCQYAVDWVHPLPWNGPVLTRVRNAGSLAELRAMRNSLPAVAGAGSHLSWMGGTQAHVRKLDMHCHLEMTKATEDALRSGEWLREGKHSDGHKLLPADVDETWPRWVQERKCPPDWFRPRREEQG